MGYIGIYWDIPLKCHQTWLKVNVFSLLLRVASIILRNPGASVSTILDYGMFWALTLWLFNIT